MKFRIIENPIDPCYEYIKNKVAKHENFTNQEIIEKFNTSTSTVSKKYHRACSELEVEPYRKRGKTANPKNYFYDKRREKWKVVKIIKGKQIFYGYYETEQDAKNKVIELKKTDWN